VFDAYAASHGCVAEYNKLNGGQYLLSDRINYSDVSTAWATGKLLNCAK